MTIRRPRAAMRGSLGVATLAMLAATHAAAAPTPGITTTPCAGVSVQQTAAHAAAADPYVAWRDDWLALDWGQHCRYAAENAALPPPGPDRVVFLGDSITEGWRELDPAFFAGNHLGRGIGGQTTPQMLVRFRADVLDLRPAVLHLMAGTNDIAGNTGPTSLELVEGHVMSMVEQARARGIRVVLASVPPAARFDWRPQLQPAATILKLNAWLRDYAARERLAYVDYHSALADATGGMRPEYTDDGVHPNAAGYAVMRPLAEAALRQALRGRKR